MHPWGDVISHDRKMVLTDPEVQANVKWSFSSAHSMPNSLVLYKVWHTSLHFGD